MLHTRQGGGGLERQVAAGNHPEEAEHPGGGRRVRGEGHVEHGADGGGLGLRVDPVRADDVAEPLLGFAGFQYPQQRGRTLPCDESRERVPAGHQDQALRAAREEGAHLVGGVRVVRDDEHPPARAQGAVEGRGPVRLHRDVLGGDSEGLEEAAERVDGPQRPARVVAAQVHVQLSVRKGVAAAVSPVDREGRLPVPPCSVISAVRTAPVGTVLVAGSIASSRRSASARPANAWVHPGS
ncbi:hypothetical protein ACGFX2_16115 [Streptomyces goshikiensis]|uniref:hypothetical protein n=1 Tax=Streptomyces goshikiensis TaxID=1942 RepID=UPI00371830AD